MPDDPDHALLPPAPAPTKFLTPLLSAELARVSSAADPSKAKLQALDLARYEAPEAPGADELAGLGAAEASARLQAALRRAYAAQAYVSSRRAHLALLDAYGKNAWLVGNHQLEGQLRAVERELAETRRAIDVLTLQRKEAQDQAGPEIRSLEETWKSGVGRVLETEAAAESLRREIMEMRARMAAGE